MLDNAHTHIAEAEADRHAYNAAFEELGLNWQWDAQTYGSVQARGPRGLRAYLEGGHSHLLRAYDVDFLINAIEACKARQRSGFAGHLPIARHPMHLGQSAAPAAR